MLSRNVIPIAAIGIVLTIVGGLAALYFIAAALSRHKVDQIFLGLAISALFVFIGVSLIAIAASISASV